MTSVKEIIWYISNNLKPNEKKIWYYMFSSGSEVKFKILEIYDDSTIKMSIVGSTNDYSHTMTDYSDDPIVLVTKSITYKDCYLEPKKNWNKPLFRVQKKLE